MFNQIPSVDFWSVRFVDASSEAIRVRQNILQPIQCSNNAGAMVTVFDRGACGYAATPDTSPSGLSLALEQATRWARASFKPNTSSHKGQYQSPVKQNWNSVSLEDRIALLQKCSRSLKTDPRIVDWEASLWNTTSHERYHNSLGASIEQDFTYLVPNLSATANEGSNTQSRSLHGRGVCRQAGLEILQEIDFENQAKKIGDEAIQLLLADNCPSGTMDLLLAPDQMLLQIHESIGHPLELDRILGDERNYAGTSFVTPNMFGHYRYGSDLLNITFDPTVQNEFATYAFDDEGTAAEKIYLIEKGILKNPLGGPGVANSRASSWNRPPIHRMANLNLEPGHSSISEMIENIEHGILMKANTSWSIDDSRNKFQFGCELGQIIKNGKLTRVVRNPNYRGISATFWRNLKMVGNRDTFEMYGSPFCGKGEPNQVIRVGHASPACLFSNVDVFGGM